VITLSVTTALLGFLALTAGADSFLTLMALAVAAVVIWSPWRKA
jgi:hypothetical protein